MRNPDPWDPAQYERFKDERRRPFDDLLTLVRNDSDPMRIVDLGCGTGELTRILHQRLRAKDTLGIDHSASMLARAASQPTAGLSFAQGTIEEFDQSDDPVELIFSNAALHWVPDHPSLFERLTRSIRTDGGQIAIQIPTNDDHPSHLAANEVAREAPFVEALNGYERRSPVLAPDAYAKLLHQLGFAEQHVRVQVYTHLLRSRGELVEWTSGTLLTEVRSRLDPVLYRDFINRYRECLTDRLEDEEPYLYTFKRVLLWARRGRDS